MFHTASSCFSSGAQQLRRLSEHGSYSKQQQQTVFGCRYILPSLSLVPSDHEEGVKVQYALVLAQLAGAANRFLLHLQHLANTQLQPHPSSPTLVSHSTPHKDMHSCLGNTLICALLDYLCRTVHYLLLHGMAGTLLCCRLGPAAFCRSIECLIACTLWDHVVSCK